ncbi:lactate racemase domain-containing protein [Myxococcota bacterium]|nr:lactate racemase domain-containing protein [Myxococcota bacterium]
MIPREKDNVVYIDSDSAPRIIPAGEDFLYEHLPIGTRVVYPNPPMKGLPHPDAAIRYALNHPEGMDPLFSMLKPSMKICIVMDDISLPLPQMKTPDVRERILTIVLQMLDDHGVDDIDLLIANALHRRMTPAEMKRMVGAKIFERFYPKRFINHDAEDPEAIVTLGHTELGEVVKTHRLCAEADLVIYVNINLVPMDGGHKSMGIGTTDYQGLKAHHNPKTMRECDSYMDPTKSALADSGNRIGRVLDKHLKVFHIETALNNRMYDKPMEFLAKNEDDFTELDRLAFQSLRWTLGKLPRAAKREVFHKVPSPYELIAVHAGATEPVHEKILAKNFEQYSVPVKGQADIMIVGIPYISPYNVNSILNPVLVQVMGLGYLYNLYRGAPLVKDGGVVILCHPLNDDFDQQHHPSYIEFFHRCLPETRDAFELHKRFEKDFATNPTYIEMYRRGTAYHGAHPFYMWYWGERGRSRVGKVIAVGAENEHVPRILGWESVSTLTDAIERAKDFTRPNPDITLLHIPPILVADVTK